MRRGILRIVGGAVACGPALVAQAGQWSLGGFASQQFQYEDNINVATTGDKVSSPASVSALGLSVGNATPVWDVGLTSLFTFSRFFDESGLDSDDQTINAGVGYRTPSGRLRLQGSVIRDTTRTSDLLGTGQFVLANKRRNVFTGGPTWTYELDPLNTIDLLAAFTYVDYPSAGDELVGYRQISGGGTWTRKITQNFDLQTQLQAFHYETTNIGDLQNEYVAALFGFVYRPTERWRTSFAVGPAVTVSDGSLPDSFDASQSGTRVGYAIQADTSYLATDDITLRANLTRTAAPNVTTGVLQEVIGLTLSYEQFVLPKTAFYVNGLYQHQDYVGSGTDRDYLAFEPGVRVRLSDDFNLWVGYRLQWQEYDPPGRSGVANAALARISYNFPTWSEAP